MRKVVLCDMISLDGYFEGPGEGWETIDWHRADDEWERYSIELLAGTGTLLFGRRTYEGFASFWPTQEGELARMLNEMPKVVFSRTLERAGWGGTRLVRDGAAEEVARMKEEQGKDIMIFGSANFASTLMRDGMVDEYRLGLNPVVLGGGSPLFKPGGERLNLRLADTRTFASGIVLLTFTPDREARA